MSDSGVSGAPSPAGDVAQREHGSGHPAAVPAAAPAVSPPRWTAGRVTALVIGAILVAGSIGLLGAGGTALVVAAARRDAAGYVTTGVHAFSTGGSALVTDPVQLDSPGVGWLYSSVVLGNVRIRITPADPDTPLFVAIAPSDQVDGYLAGISHTRISDFWRERVTAVSGATPTSPPETHDWWVASATGRGAQTLTWDPANGSWSVVVMNADAHAGIEVATDLGATFPTLVALAVAALVLGGVVLLGGALLITGATRRGRARQVVTP